MAGKIKKYLIYSVAALAVLLAITVIVYLWPQDLQSPKFSDTVTFLGFILAFATFASYFLFEMNKRDIEEQTKQFEEKLNKAIERNRQMLRDERIATRVGTNTSTAASFLYLYIYQKGDAFDKVYREKLLEIAINYARLSVTSLKSIKDKAPYEEIESTSVNNLCFALTLKAASKKEYDGYKADKEVALSCVEQLSKWPNKMKLQATRALAMWVFSERKEQKEEARKIIDQIKSSSTEEELKDVWNLVLGERRLP